MNWRRGIFASTLIVCFLFASFPATTAYAFGPYETLYVGHIAYGTQYEYTYVYQNNITHHAYTFDAAAGDVLTLSTQWITDPPPAGYGDPWQPDIIITPGLPSVGVGQVFTWDWEADFGAGKFLPKDLNNIEKPTITDWEVPASGSYMMHISFYPYEPSSGGIYSLIITPGTAAPAEPSPAGEAAQGEEWQGEFTQLENGDYFTQGTLDSSRTWTTHSFTADPGDMLTIIAWSDADVDWENLVLRLALCEGGCNPAGTNALDLVQEDTGFAVINYTVPPTAAAGTLYTALVDSGGTFNDYTLWMRQWQARALLNQIAGGLTGELPQIEGGDRSMEGVLTHSDAYHVHSFPANPGDSFTVTVTAKRETDADELIPVALLVPGGYSAGEQWLAMAMSEDTGVSMAVTIPAFMPPGALYTIVITDTSNAGQLLFGDAPVYEYGGGYRVTVDYP